MAGDASVFVQLTIKGIDSSKGAVDSAQAGMRGLAGSGKEVAGSMAEVDKAAGASDFSLKSFAKSAAKGLKGMKSFAGEASGEIGSIGKEAKAASMLMSVLPLPIAVAAIAIGGAAALTYTWITHARELSSRLAGLAGTGGAAAVESLAKGMRVSKDEAIGFAQAIGDLKDQRLAPSAEILKVVRDNAVKMGLDGKEAVMAYIKALEGGAEAQRAFGKTFGDVGFGTTKSEASRLGIAASHVKELQAQVDAYKDLDAAIGRTKAGESALSLLAADRVKSSEKIKALEEERASVGAVRGALDERAAGASRMLVAGIDKQLQAEREHGRAVSDELALRTRLQAQLDAEARSLEQIKTAEDAQTEIASRVKNQEGEREITLARIASIEEQSMGSTNARVRLHATLRAIGERQKVIEEERLALNRELNESAAMGTLAAERLLQITLKLLGLDKDQAAGAKQAREAKKSAAAEGKQFGEAARAAKLAERLSDIELAKVQATGADEMYALTLRQIAAEKASAIQKASTTKAGRADSKQAAQNKARADTIKADRELAAAQVAVKARAYDQILASEQRAGARVIDLEAYKADRLRALGAVETADAVNAASDERVLKAETRRAELTYEIEKTNNALLTDLNAKRLAESKATDDQTQAIADAKQKRDQAEERRADTRLDRIKERARAEREAALSVFAAGVGQSTDPRIQSLGAVATASGKAADAADNLRAAEKREADARGAANAQTIQGQAKVAAAQRDTGNAVRDQGAAYAGLGVAAGTAAAAFIKDERAKQIVIALGYTAAGIVAAATGLEAQAIGYFSAAALLGAGVVAQAVGGSGAGATTGGGEADTTKAGNGQQGGGNTTINFSGGFVFGNAQQVAQGIVKTTRSLDKTGLGRLKAA